MSVGLLIEETPLSLRAARVVDGQAVALRHFYPSRSAPLWGALYKAKVTAHDKRLGAAFLDIGGQNAFLRRSGPLPEIGRSLIVDIRREPIGGKGADVSDRPALRLPMVTKFLDSEELKPGPLGEVGDVPFELDDSKTGLIDPRPVVLRLLMALLDSDVTAIAVTRPDTKNALAPFLPEDMPIDVLPVEDAAAILDEAEEEGLSRWHGLPGGGRLAIDETEALFAVDLDLGKQSGQSKKGAGTKILGDALAQLGRLGPVMGLGGQIVIDVPRGAIAAPKIVRDQITRALKPLGRVSVPAVTPEGMCVVIAPRSRPSLLEVMTEESGDDPRPARRLKADVVAAKAFQAAERALNEHKTASLILFVTERGIPLLANDSAAMHDLEARFGPRLTVKPMADGHPKGPYYVDA